MASNQSMEDETSTASKKRTANGDTKSSTRQSNNRDHEDAPSAKRSRFELIKQREQLGANRRREFMTVEQRLAEAKAAQVEEETRALLDRERTAATTATYTSEQPIKSEEVGDAALVRRPPPALTFEDEFIPESNIDFKREKPESCSSWVKHVQHCFDLAATTCSDDQAFQRYASMRKHERGLLDPSKTIRQVVSVRNDRGKLEDEEEEEGDKKAVAARMLLATTSDLLVAVNLGTKQLEVAWHAWDSAHQFHALGIELPSADCIVTADRNQLLVSASDGSLRLVTMNVQQRQRPMMGDLNVIVPAAPDWQNAKPPLAAAMCMSDRYIAVLYERKCLCLFDRDSGKGGPIVDATSNSTLRRLVDGVCCVIDRDTLFVGTARGDIWRFGLTNRNINPMPGGAIHRPLEGDSELPTRLGEGESILYLCVKGRRVAAASPTKIRVWDSTQSEDGQPHAYDLPWANIVGMRFAGNLLVAHNTFGIVIVFDLLRRANKEPAQFYYDTFHPCSQFHFDNVAVSLNELPFIVCMGTGGLVTYVRLGTQEELSMREQARRELAESDADLEEQMSQLKVSTEEEDDTTMNDVDEKKSGKPRSEKKKKKKKEKKAVQTTIKFKLLSSSSSSSSGSALSSSAVGSTLSLSASATSSSRKEVDDGGGGVVAMTD